MHTLLAAMVIGLMIEQPPPAPSPGAAPAATATGPYHVEKTFAVGGEGSWDYVAIDPDVQRLYVPRGSHVMVLDANTGKALGDVADTAGVHGVAIAVDLGKGFTSNGQAGTVTVFDLKTLKPTAIVTVGTNPDAILYEPTTKRVFVFNGRSSDATVIDATNDKALKTIPIGGKPEFAVHDGAGTIFVNVEDTGEVLRLNAKDMSVEKRFKIAPGEEPSGLAIDAAHKRLFAVCSNEKMVVLDAETGKVLATPAIGKGVDGAAFDAAGGYALASNGEGTLSVISTKDGDFKVAQTLATAPRARTCVIDPRTRRIYLPTAEIETPKEPAKDGKPKRPTFKPGTFKIIVVTP